MDSGSNKPTTGDTGSGINNQSGSGTSTDTGSNDTNPKPATSSGGTNDNDNPKDKEDKDSGSSDPVNNSGDETSVNPTDPSNGGHGSDGNHSGNTSDENGSVDKDNSGVSHTDDTTSDPSHTTPENGDTDKDKDPNGSDSQAGTGTDDNGGTDSSQPIDPPSNDEHNLEEIRKKNKLAEKALSDTISDMFKGTDLSNINPTKSYISSNKSSLDLITETDPNVLFNVIKSKSDIIESIKDSSMYSSLEEDQKVHIDKLLEDDDKLSKMFKTNMTKEFKDALENAMVPTNMENIVGNRVLLDLCETDKELFEKYDAQLDEFNKMLTTGIAIDKYGIGEKYKDNFIVNLVRKDNNSLDTKIAKLSESLKPKVKMVEDEVHELKRIISETKKDVRNILYEFIFKPISETDSNSFFYTNYFPTTTNNINKHPLFASKSISEVKDAMTNRVYDCYVTLRKLFMLKNNAGSQGDIWKILSEENYNDEIIGVLKDFSQIPSSKLNLDSKTKNTIYRIIINENTLYDLTKESLSEYTEYTELGNTIRDNLTKIGFISGNALMTPTNLYSDEYEKAYLEANSVTKLQELRDGINKFIMYTDEHISNSGGDIDYDSLYNWYVGVDKVSNVFRAYIDTIYDDTTFSRNRMLKQLYLDNIDALKALKDKIDLKIEDRMKKVNFYAERIRDTIFHNSLSVIFEGDGPSATPINIEAGNLNNDKLKTVIKDILATPTKLDELDVNLKPEDDTEDMRKDIQYVLDSYITNTDYNDLYHPTAVLKALLKFTFEHRGTIETWETLRDKISKVNKTSESEEIEDCLNQIDSNFESVAAPFDDEELDDLWVKELAENAGFKGKIFDYLNNNEDRISDLKK